MPSDVWTQVATREKDNGHESDKAFSTELRPAKDAAMRDDCKETTAKDEKEQESEDNPKPNSN